LQCRFLDRNTKYTGFHKEQPMQLFSWLCARIAGRTRTPRMAACKTRPRCRPQLEALESRDVPSTLTVLSPNGLTGVIGAAASGDTIVFAPSLDGQTIQLVTELNITKSLNIQGPGAGLLAIQPSSDGLLVNPRIMEVAANVTVTISGLTLANGGGTAFGYAGGNTDYTTPAYDSEGGAILNFGTLTVSACTLTGNSVSPATAHAVLGGAIYNAGTLTVTGSTLSGNHADWSEPSYVGDGGAIYNTGTATLSGCTLTNNIGGTGYAIGLGGAIYNAGTLTVSSCMVTGNTATYGGGIYTVGALTLTGDTVQSNTATSAGGGIYNAALAAVHLDAWTLKHVINNTAHKDRNIDGTYMVT
jgi:predicted outer membrane repeat protein